MTDSKSNDSNIAPMGLVRRIKDVALNKTIEVILMAAFAALASFFGWQHWFGGAKDPSLAESTSEVIEEGNIGFKRTSAWLGLRSHFETFTDGRGQSPFSEMKTGTHTIAFSAKAKTSSGGFVGVGSTKTYWGITGSLSGDFRSNSLKALLDDGAEEFMTQTILPVIRDSASKHLPEVIVDEEVNDVGIQQLQQQVRDEVAASLSDEYDIGEVSLNITEVRMLVKADLKSDHIDALDKATCETIIRNVGDANKAGGGFSRILSIGFAGAFLIVLGLFFVASIFN